MQHPTTIRLDQDTVIRLNEIAEATDSTRAAVIKEAVEQFLAYDAWFRLKVKQGLDAAREGRVVSHDEAKDRMRTLGIALE